MNQLEFMILPSIQPKEKRSRLLDLILKDVQCIESIIKWAENERRTTQSIVMETFEEYTRITEVEEGEMIWRYASKGIKSTHPSLLRESARVLGNLARTHIEQADEVIPRLLELTEHSGTVVRWASATALSAFHKSDLKAAWKLQPTFCSIAAREEKESIRKIYLKAIKHSIHGRNS